MEKEPLTNEQAKNGSQEQQWPSTQACCFPARGRSGGCGCPLCRPWVLLIVLLVVLALVGSNLWSRLQAVRSSEPYRLAVSQVLSSAIAQEHLGTPIRDVTWFPAGRVYEEGDLGEANFAFKVAGSLKAADVFVQARRLGGRWTLTVLELRLADGKAVNLKTGGSNLGDEPRAGEVGIPSGLDEAPRWVPPVNHEAQDALEGVSTGRSLQPDSSFR